MSNSTLNTTKIDFKYFFKNSQFLLENHLEKENIYSRMSSNVQKMRMFLETPQVLEELNKKSIDTIKLRKEIDFLADILTTVFNNTWHRHNDEEIESVKKYYEIIYLESIATLKKFSVSSTDHLKFLSSSLNDLAC